MIGSRQKEGKRSGSSPAMNNILAQVRIGYIAMAVATVFVVTILAFGNWWWNAQAQDLKHRVLYSTPPLRVSFNRADSSTPGTDQLTLLVDEDFWHKTRKDQWSMSLIPDHGHLMHVFLLRVPAMDRFYHLHPGQASDGSFA